jgi:hypothetical protein
VEKKSVTAVEVPATLVSTPLRKNPHHIGLHGLLTFNSYVDGEIVREGPAGDHGDGAFSVGVSPRTQRALPILPDIHLEAQTDLIHSAEAQLISALQASRPPSATTMTVSPKSQ